MFESDRHSNLWKSKGMYESTAFCGPEQVQDTFKTTRVILGIGLANEAPGWVEVLQFQLPRQATPFADDALLKRKGIRIFWHDEATRPKDTMRLKTVVETDRAARSRGTGLDWGRSRLE